MNTRPTLPEPSAEARAASIALCERIAAEIQAAGGWIPFSRYMELALYTPGLGYYSGGAQKFGAAGDFITSPEITPLFSRTLAIPATQIMAQSTQRILEIGAGSGALAVELLLELERLDNLPDEYLILDLSGELRARQQATLRERTPQLLGRVVWIDTLPQKFSGLVLGNEVLDAMPAALVEWHDDESPQIPGIAERGVMLDDQGGFVWANRPAQGVLLQAAQGLGIEGPYPYLSEIGLAASSWVAEWGRRLECGALLLIDYGFPRPEFYHPQRSNGTLRCHYRHHAHDNPFWWPGLNDITTHVDFTAIAEAGFDAGLDVLGYTTQARYLLNCGITEVLGRLSGDGEKAYLGAARKVDKLISPNEMGELFKVIALGRGLKRPLAGFTTGDRLHTL